MDEEKKPFAETVPNAVHLERAYKILTRADREASDIPSSLPEGRVVTSKINERGEEVDSRGKVRRAPPCK